MIGKSVAAPGLWDQVGGPQFALLMDSPIVELGFAALILSALAKKVFNLV